jgi:formylglycine-generating enzyme required for sulfatase activity
VMSESAPTRSGFIAGTPQYMSPEQANGKPLDHRSDLFSLGSVLYSLCTGQVAFHAESAIAVLRRVTDHEPGPIRSLNPAIPAWLCEVIAKLMAKQPEDRIQSAKEVADLLTRCQAPNRERRDGPTTARLPASSIASQGSSRGPVTAKLKGTLIAVALLAGVVLAVVFSRGRNPRPTGLDLTATNPSERPQAEGVSPDAAKVPPRAIAQFNAEKAQQHQEAWAAHLKLPIEFTNSIGMKFRLIPPGEFLMGSTPEEIEAALKEVGEVKHWQECIQSEAPQHKVILTQPIYLGVNEVTQAEYEKVMGVNPSYFAPMGMGKEAVAGQETAQHPVEMVSWNDAVEFCAKLSKQENLKPFYFRAGETITPLAGTGYHLPSEAAWEFACRAGTATKFWIGDKDGDLARAGWFGENSGGRTHAAGELTTNPFGLSDIHGNVWEWVQDGWDATYYGQFPDKTAINPGVPFHAGSRRLIRGGDWTYAAFNCRSSHRYTYDYNSSYRSDRIGFRVSLVVDAVKQSREKQPAASAPVEARSRHGWPAGSPAPAIAPFNAEQAQQHQEAWAAHLKLPIEFTNSIGMKFRLIPPGEFLMGSTSEDIEAELKRPGLQGHLQFWRKHIESEGPQHKVVLTKPIYVGVTEVTQAQYEQVMGTTPSQFSPTGQGKDAVANLETGNYPVEMVSCNESAEFCAKLSQQDKLKPFNFRSDQTMMSLEGTGYRLPTEAEWEFFCRAGTTTRFWSGDENEDLIRAGWCFSNAGGRTHAASELKSNPFGLSDLHGNVWEWVQDGWDPKFYGQFQENVATNPFSPLSASSMPMRRGGSLMQVPELVRSSSRLCYPTNAEAGFRVVLFADAVKELLGKTEAEIKG